MLTSAAVLAHPRRTLHTRRHRSRLLIALRRRLHVISISIAVSLTRHPSNTPLALAFLTNSLASRVIQVPSASTRRHEELIRLTADSLNLITPPPFLPTVPHRYSQPSMKSRLHKRESCQRRASVNSIGFVFSVTYLLYILQAHPSSTPPIPQTTSHTIYQFIVIALIPIAFAIFAALARVLSRVRRLMRLGVGDGDGAWASVCKITVTSRSFDITTSCFVHPSIFERPPPSLNYLPRHFPRSPSSSCVTAATLRTIVPSTQRYLHHHSRTGSAKVKSAIGVFVR
ncbi:hypothetical protein SISNIDRAFT_481532 [Sistotremastrum niveocremeum HHB9708]|uniref:Uncharacterized protein n=1 Tax=Sistotremastrum niveocremeum HHB9708 TaxID=1314777 RepID=A0A164ZD28_9AGAM|nr:hypothetical protein SISNIDRAFT_481532 [Sistotremastrum niveocremeum HHB9708]